MIYTLNKREKKRGYRVRFRAMSRTIMTKLPNKSARNALHVCGEKMDTKNMKRILNVQKFDLKLCETIVNNIFWVFKH